MRATQRALLLMQHWGICSCVLAVKNKHEMSWFICKLFKPLSVFSGKGIPNVQFSCSDVKVQQKCELRFMFGATEQ